MEAATLAGLRHQRGYPAFVGAATLSRLADEMFGVGVVLLMLDRTGSPALAGATVAAITLPSLLTGPLLGAWLDLTGRRRGLMILDHLGIAVCLVAMIALAGNSPGWVVPAIAAVTGLTYPLSFGGFTSFIPVLVPDRLLTQANAMEAVSFNMALIAGPALAGTITAVFGPGWSLAVEAALSLAALGLLLTVPRLDRPTGREPGGPTLGSIIRDGLGMIARVPELRGVTAAGALGLAGLGLLTVAFPLFAVQELGGERSDAGYLWAAFAAGSAVGALALVRIQRLRPPETIVVWALATFGLLMLTWPLAGALPVALALIAVAGMADGPGLAATFAVRQQRVPRELHGQVFTTAASLKIGAFAVGAALAGPLASGVGPSEAILAGAALQVAGAGTGRMLMRGRPGRAVPH
ncbi:MAG TPA: MFS transporter [Thermoleophilaceae bacterium]|nr:MFS transporter [Thermoleophilaceae bacterium]